MKKIELTDEQIIKALEHCADGYRCKYCEFEGRCKADVEFVAKQALVAIKHLEEKYDRT